MTRWRFLAGEAWAEMRSGLRGPMIPLVSAGLIGYLAIVLMSAEYMRDMGAADVARNSPHVVYLMAAGQAFWLFFAWAWVFSRIVTRDRDARLQEVVLSSPVSLRALLVARFVGATGTACVLGVAGVIGFLAAQPLAAIGAIPPTAVGPVPWFAMAWAWLLFSVPSAIGTGSLYTIAAVRTRSSAGPFAVAAVLVAAWMVAMVVIRGGDMDPAIATLIDPSGYAEAEEQTQAWTPVEKMSRPMALSGALLVNRILWCAVPLVLLAVFLVRVRRESLVLAGGAAKPKCVRRESTTPVPAAPTEAPESPSAPSWLLATLFEAGWQIRRSFRSWTFGLALLLLSLMGILGSMVHVVSHADGPFAPYPTLVTETLSELLFIVFVFTIAGFVGALMRRDDHLGFDEMVHATPAPLSVRLVGRGLTALTLTGALALTATFASFVVTALTVPHSLSPTTPAFYFAVVYAPALLEVSLIAILLHAVLRSAGLAHAATMLVAFILVLNQELSLVTYPPAKVGIPAPVSLSSVVGLEPWLGTAFAHAAFKLSLCALGLGLAWLAWPRGVERGWGLRLRVAWSRLRGGAGATCAVAVVLLLGLGTMLHERMVVNGDYADARDTEAANARWETSLGDDVPTFSVEGGDIVVEVKPDDRTARATWNIRGFRSSGAFLHAEVPAGATEIHATVDGKAAETRSDNDHLTVALGDCSAGCAVQLQIRLERTGWPAEETAPWLHPTQSWLRASDVLPTLGIDPDRAIVSLAARQAQGLAAEMPSWPAGSQAAAIGVAPAGTWTYRVEFPEGWQTAHEGQVQGPLDFAVAWRPSPLSKTEAHGMLAWHSDVHAVAADALLADVKSSWECLARTSHWQLPAVREVVQTPRGREIAFVNGALWLPEDQGWDVLSTRGDDVMGHWLRRWEFTRALAAAQVAAASDLRRSPGSRWLEHGVPGWLAYQCARELESSEGWHALVDRASGNVVQALAGAAGPVRTLAGDGHAEWIEEYAPLATFSWAQSLGPQRLLAVVDEAIADVAKGASVRDALTRAAGADAALAVLGPPLASDITVASSDANDPGSVTFEGLRWQWRDGDWRPEGTSTRVNELGEASGAKLDAPGSLVPRATFTLLDDWPSFERSIEDNRWSDKGADPPEAL